MVKKLIVHVLKIFKEIAGKGLTVVIDHQHYYLGNEKYFKELNLSVLQPEKIGTMVHIACGDQYLGYIVVADVIKESTIPGIQDLKKAHVKQTVMLTGDHSTVANDMLREQESIKFIVIYSLKTKFHN